MKHQKNNTKNYFRSITFLLPFLLLFFFKNSMAQSISTTSLPDATAGSAYSTTITTTGFAMSPTNYSASGLPSGLSINNSGVISGTPGADTDGDNNPFEGTEGVHCTCVTATRGGTSATKCFNLTVKRTTKVYIAANAMANANITDQTCEVVAACPQGGTTCNTGCNWDNVEWKVTFGGASCLTAGKPNATSDVVIQSGYTITLNNGAINTVKGITIRDDGSTQGSLILDGNNTELVMIGTFGIQTDAVALGRFWLVLQGQGATPSQLVINNNARVTVYGSAKFDSNGQIAINNSASGIGYLGIIGCARTGSGTYYVGGTEAGNCNSNYANLIDSDVYYCLNPRCGEVDASNTGCATTTNPPNLSCNTLLPVELLWFEASILHGKAIARQDHVKLFWVTTSETNNDYFSIERSHNGIDFKEIAQIKGGGNSKQTIEYIFIDENPLSNTSYYRLKQIDEDGHYTYSKIVSVYLKPNTYTSLKIIPNPMERNHFKVQYCKGENNDNNQHFITVFNSLGHIFFEKTLNSPLFEVEVRLQERLPAGIYYVNVFSNDCYQTQKLMIR